MYRKTVDACQRGMWALASRPSVVWLTGFTLMSLSEPSQAFSMGCGGFSGNFSSFTGLLGGIAGFLSGTFGRAAVIIAIAIFGALLMFGELKGVFGSVIKILFGGSLILMATQWAGLFNATGSGSAACNYIQSGG
ncbi:TrbC/VirB2 family protein [Acidihalobacter prosperus]|nr:TrbC/VirB2 family protein [Acidihalobacter prosperus]